MLKPIFLAKLNEKDSSLIDQEEVKDLLAYDFCRIDDEELTTDKYIEFSEFYLYRPINSYTEDRYNLFKKDCNYLLMNKEGYCNRVSYLLNNNNALANAYTNYLFDDVEKQKYLYKRTTKRLNDISNGDIIKDEDYQLLIENYKRLYLKKRVYEDIVSLRSSDIDLDLLGYNFNYLNDVINNSFSPYHGEIECREEYIPIAILEDYLELSDKLDNEYKMISTKKNKVLKK